jgi:hypothetical protein
VLDFPLFVRVEPRRVLHLQYLIEAYELDVPPNRLRVTMAAGINCVLEGPAAERARKRLEKIAPDVDDALPTITDVRDPSAASPKARARRKRG